MNHQPIMILWKMLKRKILEGTSGNGRADKPSKLTEEEILNIFSVVINCLK